MKKKNIILKIALLFFKKLKKKKQCFMLLSLTHVVGLASSKCFDLPLDSFDAAFSPQLNNF